MTTSQTDRRARFESLWAGHYEAVLAFAFRRTARDRAPDVAEETFLTAWRRLDEIPLDARVWLYGVARGVLANDRRSRKRGGALLQRLAGLPAAVAPDPGDSATGPAWEALRTLPARDQEAIALVVWEELTAAEAAAVMGCSEGAFRVRLHRARARLEAALRGEKDTTSTTLREESP
jgi:DNA-directed RNA polymerase specialized sigma24 family protein